MKNILVLLPLVFWSFVTGPVITKATANDELIEETCNSGSSGTMQECLKRKLDHSEVEMTKTFASVIDNVHNEYGERADIEIKDRLQVSQEAWLKYRDSHCSFDYYSKSPSTAQSLIVNITACKLDKTKMRIDELKKSILLLGDN